MKRRIFVAWILFAALCMNVHAETINWVDFGVPYESLKYAMDADISSSEHEKHISWIDILAVTGCRTGGKCPVNAVKKAHQDLMKDKDIQELLGDLYKYYPHKYHLNILFFLNQYPKQSYFPLPLLSHLKWQLFLCPHYPYR